MHGIGGPHLSRHQPCGSVVAHGWIVNWTGELWRRLLVMNKIESCPLMYTTMSMQLFRPVLQNTTRTGPRGPQPDASRPNDGTCRTTLSAGGSHVCHSLITHSLINRVKMSKTPLAGCRGCDQCDHEVRQQILLQSNDDETKKKGAKQDSWYARWRQKRYSGTVNLSPSTEFPIPYPRDIKYFAPFLRLSSSKK